MARVKKMADAPWAVEILEEVSSILDQLDIKWWLEAGALLGIYREYRFLPWDDADLDISVLEPANHEAIKQIFINNNYKLFAEGPHQLAFRKRQVIIDISFYTHEDDKIVMYIYGAGTCIQPYELFKNLHDIEFMGKHYPAPHPIPHYLEQRYENWLVPKKEKKPWTYPGETKAFHPELQ